MTPATHVIAMLALLVAVSGCGGTTSMGTTTGTRGPSAQGTTSATQLTAAVRTAVVAHHRLSVQALWSNRITAHQRVVDGPALADLQQALVQRRDRGVRVRLLSERFRILSIRLDPSYTAATAVVSDPQRVRPYGYDGRPLGRPVSLDENALVDLHRVDQSHRFVVWKVTPIQ